ncbi:hypothetical protein ACL02T_27700 [Pseudonocardia sp. RS010]|uniref:oxidoreductase n=1 Tax=Pseudonocardia sp. RS010 TaxID=3385979 RepID=UPI0039A3AB5B
MQQEGLKRDLLPALWLVGERAGFDGVQVHAAHGHLVAQFLSPSLNRRTDRYGGSPENRRRFLFEIVDGIRAACRPDLQLSVRISPERHGQDLYEILDTCSRLLDEGATDILDLSLWNVFQEAEDVRAGGRPLLSFFTESGRGADRGGGTGSSSPLMPRAVSIWAPTTSLSARSPPCITTTGSAQPPVPTGPHDGSRRRPTTSVASTSVRGS